MIQTEADIRRWAETIVKANGEKFTPLTKGEQFLIAKYIMDSADSASTKDSEMGEPIQDPIPDPKTEQEAKPADQQKDPQEKPKHPPMMKMTRGVAFHFSGFTAQQAFDKFLEETKGKSDMAKVMDFSTGRQSADAAFAYWLNEILNVNITD